MAKYGEGDKRWIVEDRPDGANVHNWHWAETDCLEWSKNLLTKLIANQTILAGEGNLFIKTTSLEKVEGEAYVNVRKGKIIPGYELNVSINWKGEAKDPDGKSLLIVDGVVEIPYISDENADEDPDLRVIVKDEGPIGKRLKDAFFAKGFTQSNAKISKEVGGEISFFDGSVTGTNVELQEGKLIVQKWRFGSWPDGIYSTVRLVLEEPEPGVTVVKLTQTDVPEEDRYGNSTVVENTERGWRDLIFHKIRAVFGFGV
ncbi:putative activator of Hsp90 ATPase 1, activator of Hsp90 ATPase, Aha1 [Helianthus annuus]|nr:putative activator of Hsp90 ATPase 1, activator of Hsp90 ATPase, Aha1 [Helianthus annuus]